MRGRTVHDPLPVMFLLCLLISSLIFQTASAEQNELGRTVVVGDMTTERFNHTAVRLSDGSVMVCGGTVDGSTSLRSTEVYDPSSSEWEAADDMAFPRMRHTADLLPYGRVLVAGGYQGDGHPSLLKHFNGTGNRSLDACELFDPGAGLWIDEASLHQGRFWHASVVLENGDIMVIGGLNVTSGALSSCEIFRANDRMWTMAASMATPRARFTAVLLNDGRVLVTGGHNGRTKVPFSSCEIYDPAEDTWTEAPPMNRARGYHSGALLSDGRYLVSGGFSGPDTIDLSDSEVFDPVSMEWTMAGNMSGPRHNHLSMPIGGSRVVVVGGSNALTGGCHSGLESFDGDNMEWEQTYLLTVGRIWGQATELRNGSFLISGGRACGVASPRTELYIPPSSRDGEGQVLLRYSILLTLLSVPLVFIVSELLLGSRRLDGDHKWFKNALPHILTLLYGTAVLGYCNWLFAAAYMLVTALGMLWFLRSICPYCRAYGSKACPSGYGMVSARLFDRRQGSFRKAFLMNIWVVALQWFVPLMGGLICLIIEPDPILLVLLIIFVLVAFVYLPFASKRKGCGSCPQKRDCPWKKKG